MAKENKQAEVVEIRDRRAEKRTEAEPENKAPEAKPSAPKVTTVAEREVKVQQGREHRITIARETGMTVLVAKLRSGHEPAARDVIAALLDLGARSDQADNLFQQAGRSFEQIAGTMGDVLGYLAAWEERRKMSWWRRWRTPRPEFPRFGPHVETDGKPGAVAEAEPAPVSATVH